MIGCLRSNFLRLEVKIKVLPADSDASISCALDVLKHGGLIAFPTDTVYGLGALAFDARAVERIFRAKHRPIEKAIPVLLGNASDLDLVASVIPELARRLALNFWPGPLTLVVPKNSNIPDVVSVASTVGVREPDHPFARALLLSTGPMAVTSANLSGFESPSTAKEVVKQLGTSVDLVLDGGDTPGGVPSTVVDCTGSQPIILRTGPISMEQIWTAVS